MVGLQATAIKTQLGPLLNGWINYDFWLPVPKMEFAGVGDLIKRYQAKAGAEGVDPLGCYMAPWGYAQMQVLQGQRRRPVQGHVHANRGGAGRVRIRQGDLLVREGEVGALSPPPFGGAPRGRGSKDGGGLPCC